MKKYASALALAAGLAAPAAFAQPTIDFNGEYEFNAYSVDEDLPGVGSDRASAQLLRLGVNAKLSDGVQLVTRLNLSNRTWTGNEGSAGAGVYSPDTGDNVTLDLGYVQLPLAGVLRVGRQESNWANCFVSCDDRRDRIQWVTKVGDTNIGLGYDKRLERDTNNDDDETGYYGFAIGKLGPVVAGLLIYHIRYSDDFPTAALAGDELTLVSPYFQTKLAGVNLQGAFAYQDNPVFDDAQLGAYLRAGYDFGVVNVEGQLVWSDGYEPNQGFDSFSSIINNSPENKNSALYRARNRIGRDTIGVAARVSGNVTKQVKLVGAVGYYDNGDSTDFGLADEREMTFVDLQAHYQLTPSTTVWATAGRVKVDPAAGDERDVDAFSVNVRTTF